MNNIINNIWPPEHSIHTILIFIKILIRFISLYVGLLVVFMRFGLNLLHSFPQSNNNPLITIIKIYIF